MMKRIVFAALALAFTLDSAAQEVDLLAIFFHEQFIIHN